MTDKFDRIGDLPISEELLGAYLEGNTTSDENEAIEFLLEKNTDISYILDEADSHATEEFNDAFIAQKVIDSFFENVFSGLDSSELIITDMNDSLHEITENHLGANAAARIYGEGGTGTTLLHDPLIFQGNEGVCAIRSQQIILRDYGVDVPLEELKQYAIENGWYDPDSGTPVCYVGSLLQACGVEVRQDDHCTIYDLVNELAQGHRVIVGVDADELWADRQGSIVKGAKEFLKDVFLGEEANHALVVAGVEVNPNDPNDVKVVLTDPGMGDLRIEYTLDQFMDAWEDSECFMAATTTPAPFQYDEVHGRMVPSNFAVEQFIDRNSLPLNADVRLIDSSFAAYYDEGHLDTVGHDDYGNKIPYESFSNEYSKYRQAITVPGAFGQDHFDKSNFVSALKNLFAGSSCPDTDETNALVTDNHLANHGSDEVDGMPLSLQGEDEVPDEENDDDDIDADDDDQLFS